MTMRFSSYTKPDLTYLIPIAALLMRFLSTATANLSYFAIALYALRGRSQAIQALALSFFFTMVNPGIAAEAPLAPLGRYAVLATAALSTLYHSHMIIRRKSINPMVAATLLLGLFFLIHSLILSKLPDVSALKAISWTLTMATLVSAWSGMEAAERGRISEQLYHGLIILMLASLPLLLMDVGYLRNGRGFQGILNQPQAFGPTMALLAAWASGKMLEQARPAWSTIGLIMTCLALIILSEARTAGLALVLGVGTALLLALLFSRRPINTALPGLRSRRVHLLVLIGLLGSIAAGPQLPEFVSGFIVKRGQATSLTEAYDISRGHFIAQMLANIRNDPWLGIGFGVASEPSSMRIKRDPLLGFPTGASIEKGVLPLAVLEEVGLFGFVACLVWLWLLLRHKTRESITGLSLALTILFLNMGEFTLFSPGGLGLITLILLALVHACGRESERLG